MVSGGSCMNGAFGKPIFLYPTHNKHAPTILFKDQMDGWMDGLKHKFYESQTIFKTPVNSIQKTSPGFVSRFLLKII